MSTSSSPRWNLFTVSFFKFAAQMTEGKCLLLKTLGTTSTHLHNCTTPPEIREGPTTSCAQHGFDQAHSALVPTTYSGERLTPRKQFISSRNCLRRVSEVQEEAESYFGNLITPSFRIAFYSHTPTPAIQLKPTDCSSSLNLCYYSYS